MVKRMARMVAARTAIKCVGDGGGGGSGEGDEDGNEDGG